MIIILLCLAGFIMNILTIAATILIPNPQTIHSKLIISLGLSDLLIPVGVCTHFVFVIAFGYMNLLQYSIKKSFVNFGLIATLGNLLAMAADHYIAIIKPLEYGQIMNVFRGHCILCAVWITSALGGVADFCLTNYTVLDWQYFVIGTKLIVFLVIVGLYTKIYQEVNTVIQRNRVAQMEELHNKKAIVTTSLIIGTFFLCWIPNVVLNIFIIIKLHTDPYILGDCATLQLYRRLQLSVFIPIVTNTLCDPMIYAARLNMVQIGYRRLYNKVFVRQRQDQHCKSTLLHERRCTTSTLINSTSLQESDMCTYTDDNHVGYHESMTRSGQVEANCNSIIDEKVTF